MDDDPALIKDLPHQESQAAFIVDVVEEDGKVVVVARINTIVKIGIEPGKVRAEGYNGIAMFLTELSKYEVSTALEPLIHDALKKYIAGPHSLPV